MIVHYNYWKNLGSALIDWADMGYGDVDPALAGFISRLVRSAPRFDKETRRADLTITYHFLYKPFTPSFLIAFYDGLGDLVQNDSLLNRKNLRAFFFAGAALVWLVMGIFLSLFDQDFVDPFEVFKAEWNRVKEFLTRFIYLDVNNPGHVTDVPVSALQAASSTFHQLLRVWRALDARVVA